MWGDRSGFGAKRPHPPESRSRRPLDLVGPVLGGSSRRGTASNASGPSAPSRARPSASGSAQRQDWCRLPDDGLRAVSAHRLLVVDDVEEWSHAQVPRTGAGRMRTCTGATAHAITERGRIANAAATMSRATSTQRTHDVVESNPACAASSTSMNSSPRPYLNVTRLVARNQHHFFVPTFTHSSG